MSTPTLPELLAQTREVLRYQTWARVGSSPHEIAYYSNIAILDAPYNYDGYVKTLQHIYEHARIRRYARGRIALHTDSNGIIDRVILLQQLESFLATIPQENLMAKSPAAESIITDEELKTPALRPGFVHQNQKSMNEWSFGTHLTNFQMPVDGVVWAKDLLERSGSSAQTPMLAMRAVFVNDSIFMAFGTGSDKPTRLTMRIPRLALLTLLAKAESMDLKDQEATVYYLDEHGALMDGDVVAEMTKST